MTNPNPQPRTQMVTRQPLEFGTLSAGLTGNPVVDIFLCPERFEQLQRGANLLANSKIVPTHFQGNVGGCFIAMNIALQLGVEPFSFMQKTYIIGGKLGIEAQVAIAVANQRRVFKEPLKYVFSGEYGKNPTRKCVCTGILSANGATVEMPLTWAEVDAEGWNKKEKSKWMTIPDQMFRYRTALWLIRTYAPEVLLGLNTVDELNDADVIDITPTKNQGAASALMGGEDLGAGTTVTPTPVTPPVSPATSEPHASEKKKSTKKEKTEAPKNPVPPQNPPKEPETKQGEQAGNENAENTANNENGAAGEGDKNPPQDPPKEPELTEAEKLEKAVAEAMKKYEGAEFIFSSPFTLENGSQVIKALQKEANINDNTLPIMVRNFTNGVTDQAQWTPENWDSVRKMLLSVLKRSAETKARMKK